MDTLEALFESDLFVWNLRVLLLSSLVALYLFMQLLPILPVASVLLESGDNLVQTHDCR